MPKIAISKELVPELCDLKKGQSLELDGKTYQFVEQGEWDDQGKYQYQEVIFKLDDKFYSASISRNGSYFTDYYFDYPTEAYEVVQVEKTVKVWECVPDLAVTEELPADTDPGPVPGEEEELKIEYPTPDEAN